MAARGVEWLFGQGAARRYLLAIALLAPITMTRLVGFPPLTHNAYELPKAVLVWVLALAALLSWAIDLWRRGGDVRLTWWFLPAGLYVGWTAVASAVSGSPATSFLGSHARLDGFLTTLSYGAIAFVAVQVFSSGREITSLVRAIVVSGLLVGAYAMLQIVGLDPALYLAAGGFTSGRVFSTFGNPVFLGGYLVIVLPLGVALGIAEEDVRWRAAGWAAAALAVVGLLATTSRTAWLAGALEIGLVIAIGVRKRVRPGRAGAFAAAAAAVAGAAYVVRSLASSDPALNVAKRLASLFSAPSDSSLERLIIAKAAWRAVLARPAFGYGPDRFVVAFRRFRPTEHVRHFPAGDYVDAAHSVPLQIAATAGVVASLAWVTAIVWPIVAAAPTAFSAANDRARLLFGGVWVAAVGAGIYLLTGISVVAVTATVWILLAILVGSRARTTTPPAGRRLAALAALVAAVLLLASVTYGGLLLTADNRYMAARMYLSGDAIGNPATAVRQAIALLPTETLYRRDLASQLAGTGSAGELDALNAVLALEPDDAHFLMLKARLLAREGRTAEAQRSLQRALRLAPTDPLVRGAADSVGVAP